jgi:hypothetical protein
MAFEEAGRRLVDSVEKHLAYYAGHTGPFAIVKTEDCGDRAAYMMVTKGSSRAVFFYADKRVPVIGKFNFASRQEMKAAEYGAD